MPPPIGSANPPSAPPATGAPVPSTPAEPRVTSVPRAVPTRTPAPSPSETAAASLVVTEADNDATLQLSVGQRLMLGLGSSLDWALIVANPVMVERVAGVLDTKGAQGLYVARATDTTVLSAVGSPHCASGSVCPMFRLAFSLTDHSELKGVGHGYAGTPPLRDPRLPSCPTPPQVLATARNS